MANPGTRLWHLAYNTIFPRRALDRQADQPSKAKMNNSEVPDGFELYTQAMLEQETDRLAALELQPSHSTETSFASARTEPDSSPQPTVPYAVGSKDWASIALSGKADGDTIELSEANFKSLLSVFSRVYAIAKIVCIILLNYGVEIEDTEGSLLRYIMFAEEIITSNSPGLLIRVMETLYYALYSRLVMELSNVDLCSAFHMDVRQLNNTERFMLPSPLQLYHTLLVFKEALDSPMIRSILDRKVVRAFQREIIQQASSKRPEVDSGTDPFGYRSLILGIATDVASSFREKWDNLSDVYVMPDTDLLTTLSERYLALFPKMTVKHDISCDDLPFIDPKSVPEDEWEKRRRASHHDSAMAILISKCIGWVRRDEAKRTVIDFVKEQKCVCDEKCSCSVKCTFDPERFCPCAEYIMRIMLSQARKTGENMDFEVRCTSLATAIFYCLCALRSDLSHSERTLEADRVIKLFDNEIQIQRDDEAKAKEAAKDV